ncbi:YceI family protein [Pedobacter sp. ASV1-7]|uniref:YceI family protein n=1 Tax=Pedobacter sp. ASV1-7 TaxID=3145237 RepID=UPI0032E8E377
MKRILLGIIIPGFLMVASCGKEIEKTETYKINESASVIEWKGSATDHFHIGSFKVSGVLVAGADGKVKSGDFTIPISSIENFDLQDAVKQQLLDHLKSADFFNMAIHPNAKFHFTKSDRYYGKDEEAIAGANYLLTGDFTMLGQTHPISFLAKITTNKESLFVEANFKIDRTKWGMMMDSDPEKPLYIFPDVNIKLRLALIKSK